jgi:HPt (histidine-containing phosphotransfer) domain-containing protein
MSLHALERLAEMKKVPVEHEIGRYLKIVDDIKGEIEKAMADLDWDETGHRVHALLGHTGLISCAALTGVIMDFQTVVHARDDAALEKEWERVTKTLAELKQNMNHHSTLTPATK